MYSPLIPSAQRNDLLSSDNSPTTIRSTVSIALLSEFPLLVSGQIKLHVPVYTVWGACEDVAVLEKIRTGAYAIDNLHVVDEATTRCIHLGGIHLRILGLGGALVPHKMFDNGEGQATIAGGGGTMWTTVLQMGELVDTAQRVYDPSETRLLLTHASPGREGLISQLALSLKVDMTISAGLHFRHATSYNDFSVQSDFDGFKHRIRAGKDAFDKVWDSVKNQVDAVIDENQRVLLDKALHVFDKLLVGTQTTEDPTWKNTWNWNLCDAAYGSLVFDIRDGRISSELKSQGFNYAYRKNAVSSPGAPKSATATPAPASAVQAPQKAATPIAAADHPLPPSTVASPPPTQPTQPPVINTNSNTITDGDQPNREKKKGKDKKERKDRDTTDSPVPSEDALIKSPVTTSDGGGGARTPTTTRPAKQRNPWTLWMRLTVPMTEPEVRDFFSDAASGILRVSYANNPQGKNQMSIYVEFGDEDGMKRALEGKKDKFKDTIPEVIQATDRESRDPHHASGRGRGRGGRGGGAGGSYAARGLSAAGLVGKRGGSQNKDNASSS